MKKIIIGVIVFIFLIIAIIPARLTISAGKAKTIFVNDDGNADYIKIQEALDNASNKDTIFVYNGVYKENIKINKSINLLGENKDNTFIDGNKLDDVVIINHDDVYISGFKIINSDNINGIGIRVNSNSNKIVDNNIIENSVGIKITGVSKNFVKGNKISKNKNGIVVFSAQKDNIITGNFIENNDNDGIYLYRSDNNSINDNHIIGNKYNGINVLGSLFNTIYHNNFINNGLNANDIWNNNWYNNTTKEGNYWDDYSGVDVDNDGLGDVPYNISNGINQDIYPLISIYKTEEEQDNNPPIVEIIHPKNAIYVNNNMIISFFIPIILGPIALIINAYDYETDISSMRLYINNILLEVFTNGPDNFIWDDLAFGKKTIRFDVFDAAGNLASNEIVVWKFF